MKKALIILAAGLFILSLHSCKFQKVMKNGSVDEKYETAMKLYEQKDYSRALQLFDQLIGVMRATDKAQKIYYAYAYCYYNQRDYSMASYYFKRFANNFPNAPESEECFFMSAYCLFMQSPAYSLDQTTTYEAIKELQLFTNMYPMSKRISECNDLIDKLREKLEMKDYRIAKLYFRMDDYAAAVQVLSNILKEFPGTPHKEEVLFLVFKSYHKYAKASIDEKKKERHQKALAAYDDFVALYPESQFLAEANTLKAKTQAHLAEIYQQDQERMAREANKTEPVKTN
jgi:outer membrane protein assembly factor BamD